MTIRTTKPEKGNKYYIAKANGGWSNAIKGSPTDKDCDVLANCVGYAYGRFNEIAGDGSCKYLAPVNAENFIQYKGDCEVGQLPKAGAVMVWQKGATLNNSDGAGHVAIVERVDSETQVFTSESGWGCANPFWNATRKKGMDGNWGAGNGYKFLGFIYNPKIISDVTEPIETTKNPYTESIETLRKGSKGDGVKWLQWFLKKSGYDIEVDGIFGDYTEKSVKEFQRLNNLEVDGVVGKNTKAKLNTIFSKTEIFEPYLVKITAYALNVRKGAGTNYAVVKTLVNDQNIYTIIEEVDGSGAKKWGKLKSGAGWISLDYTAKQ
ncbi:hypothetical protein FACS1894132_14160 [Clostridia bacterium]|nr:hypothetical protein FACS1894132_14160 [Clostridia bacterium]